MTDSTPSDIIIGLLSISLALVIFKKKLWKKKKKRERKQKQHETSEYGIRWSLRGTHSTAALALCLREVFLKRTQALRNKWNSAGTGRQPRVYLAKVVNFLFYHISRLLTQTVIPNAFLSIITSAQICLCDMWRTRWKLQDWTGLDRTELHKYGLHWTTCNQSGSHGQE